MGGMLWEVAGRCKSILGGIGRARVVLVYSRWLLGVLILVGWRRRVVVDCGFHVVGGIAPFSTFPKERHCVDSDRRVLIEEFDIDEGNERKEDMRETIGSLHYTQE